MFEHINEKLMAAKKDLIHDDSSNIYIYDFLMNAEVISDVDFSKFTVEDITNFRDNVFEIIATEDDDGYCTLDTNHPYCQLRAIYHKMYELERAPKQRITSSFSFL